MALHWAVNSDLSPSTLVCVLVLEQIPRNRILNATAGISAQYWIEDALVTAVELLFEYTIIRILSDYMMICVFLWCHL